jgi:hypothetical protein
MVVMVTPALKAMRIKIDKVAKPQADTAARTTPCKATGIKRHDPFDDYSLYYIIKSAAGLLAEGKGKQASIQNVILITSAATVFCYNSSRGFQHAGSAC